MVVAAVAEPAGESWSQVADLLIAFALSSVIGVEREIRGKSAGLRTHAIVGTASALFVLVSKYGFADVLLSNRVALDPSRVAAQIVSGIGFLGAGLIITRRGGVRGLTTAATIWETAAIGAAAGAGLPLLAATVAGLHVATLTVFTPLSRVLPELGRGVRQLRVTYFDQRGALRSILSTCAERQWTVVDLAVGQSDGAFAVVAESNGGAANGTPRTVTVDIGLSGRDVRRATAVLAHVRDVVNVVDANDEG
ncbi:MAG TPA: MgtC/SapB family protein [Jatrophihabitans sp.]|nr:MgtC/SapB family protein [Jatrophihabitans sp.]